MVDLNGAGVIVTGGASGLGEASVRRLAAAGANVVIADLNETRGKEIAAELGGGTEFARCDVENDEEVEEVVRIASSRGPLRVAVNCGGRAGGGGRIVGRDGTPASHEGFSITVESFLVGTFNVMRIAAAQMAKEEANEDNERGVVIMTSSIAAFDGQIGQAAYSAAKGGIVGLTLPCRARPGRGRGAGHDDRARHLPHACVQPDARRDGPASRVDDAVPEAHGPPR